MGYRNAQDIFPEWLLRQIQRYVAGETIYIPAGNEKKAWGETSGYQRYIRERNEKIRTGFAGGLTIEELMDKYALSYDSIKRIVYNRKENAMLKYSATLSAAKAYAEAGKLDAWIHLYLNEEGRKRSCLCYLHGTAGFYDPNDGAGGTEGNVLYRAVGAGRGDRTTPACPAEGTGIHFGRSDPAAH